MPCCSMPFLQACFAHCCTNIMPICHAFAWLFLRVFFCIVAQTWPLRCMCSSYFSLSEFKSCSNGSSRKQCSGTCTRCSCTFYGECHCTLGKLGCRRHCVFQSLALHVSLHPYTLASTCLSGICMAEPLGLLNHSFIPTPTPPTKNTQIHAYMSYMS